MQQPQTQKPQPQGEEEPQKVGLVVGQKTTVELTATKVVTVDLVVTLGGF